MITDDLKISGRDVASAVGKGVAKSIVNSVPGGAIASELIDLLVVLPVSKRRDEWFIDIATELEKIKDKVESFDYQKLSDSEEFISIILTATQIALKNHQDEKLLALRNCVINTAMNIDIEENRKLMYLGLVDRLTPLHIKVLCLFNNPSNYDTGIKHNDISSLSALLRTQFPNEDIEILEVVTRELNSFGLLPDVQLGVTMTGTGVLESRNTDFGKAFIRFISSPEED